MGKTDWGMVGAIAAIIGAIGTIIGTTIAAILAWDQLKTIGGWLWLFLFTILIIDLVFIYYRRQKVLNIFKSKPHLAVKVIDVNCYIHSAMVNRGAQIGTVNRTTWEVELTLKIENKGPATATSISHEIDFIVGQGDQTEKFTKGAGRPFKLAKKEILPSKIRFHQVELGSEEFKFYPSTPYYLKYRYSCNELPDQRRLTVKGKITKVDWIGDQNALRMIKNLGFYD